MTNSKQLLCYIKIFIVSFVSMIIILLSNVIYNHGVYLYADDYFKQQIPFYFHSVDVVNRLGVGWDWLTDLGSDFLTSYSFYLSGSFFFWIISWIKGQAIIYVMPIMLALKVSIGACGAFAYIKQYVKNERAAIMGAFLYAFSGFQLTVLVYNHFYDITALFPFLLLAFDSLVKENKRGVFALIVGITAITNYYFFVGIVIFTVIYYIVKCVKKEFAFTLKSFCFIVIESCIGIGMASVILLPTFLLISGANRLGDTLYGIHLLSYEDYTIIPKLIQSIFIMPDPLSGATLFRSSDGRNTWTVVSLYLPLFTITGVAVYIKNNSREWISTLLKICFIIMLIPVLNSAFSMFNSQYYARWFFMPVLIMCLATAKSIDLEYDFKYGIKVEAIGVCALAVIACLPDKVDAEPADLSEMLNPSVQIDKVVKFFSMSPVPEVFWQYIAFALISLMFIWIYDHEKNKDRKILKKISAVMVAFVIITYSVHINNAVFQLGVDGDEWYNASVGFTPEIEDHDTFRVMHTNNNDSNFSMIWGYMNAGCYHSVEPNESDEFFYHVQGSQRVMQSDYYFNDYPVCGLLSVKYIFNASTGDDLNVETRPFRLNGYSLYDKQGSYYIYQNDHFVPFGFVYDYCIDDNTLENYLNKNLESGNKYQYKKYAMLRALVLDKADIEKYRDYITPLPDNMLDGLNENTYFADCDKRSENVCSSFGYNSKGYCAEITVENPSLVYFSVPCSDGWTAKVNGKDVEIIKAHYGLTAVAVEKGENSIEFTYNTPGLKEGIIISILSISLWGIYMIINKKKRFTFLAKAKI